MERAETAERFEFLRRADGIVLVVDGPLMRSGRRHGELNRMCHVVTRLAESVKVDKRIPLVILASKCDQIDMQLPPAVEELSGHAKAAGFHPRIYFVRGIL